MSIGVVIAEVDNMMPIRAKCYIIDPAYKEGGMYNSVLLAHGKKNTYLDAIDKLSIVRLLNLDLDVYDVSIL